jgi:transposase
MKQTLAWGDEPVGACGGEASGRAAPKEGARGRPRFKRIDRGQTVFRTVVIEELIEQDHPARAIWEFSGKLDLGAYGGPVKAVEGVAGREPWDVRLLISLWIYGYSLGIGSARELARRCDYDPAFQWLTGLEKVNYHTLADLRVAHGAALGELFGQVLGVLSADGLVTLERVMHDGTKIQACAGGDSFRRERTLRAHLKAAREQVAAMGDPREDTTARQRAARERAKREHAARLEHALEEWETIREAKAGAEAKAEARASETDPEARMMKLGNGGYAPGYNAQLTTDAAHGIVVGVGLSQSASDYGELAGAIERVEAKTGRKPDQVVVDGGFTNRENIVAMDEAKVDLIGSLGDRQAQSAAQMRRRGVDEAFYPQAFEYDGHADAYRCPAGKILHRDGQEKRIGVIQHRYRASRADCAACEWKERCCPGNGTKGRSIRRAEESPPVRAFIEKMQTEAAQALYRLRGAVAEFPNAWIKAKLGLRQFHVRGKAKALSECLWACLTYNIQQWMRLRWRARPAAAAA